jgi:hypothetical protein
MKLYLKLIRYMPCRMCLLPITIGLKSISLQADKVRIS